MFEKWRAIRASVGGNGCSACMGGMLACLMWVACLQGGPARVGAVGGVLACLHGWCGWHACVGSVLAWVAC